MNQAALYTYARALAMTLMPTRCLGCQCVLVHHRPHQLCVTCLLELKPNVSRRCWACDRPGAQHACLQCPSASGLIERMRLPLEMTPLTASILERGRQLARGDVWIQLGRIIAADADAQGFARQACALVPVASDTSRLQKRGFNPSACLTRYLARAWKVDVAYCLKRTRATARQSSCKLNERYQNMTASFMCPAPCAHTVILVDDYVTTGATVHAAARALRAAGARRIFVVGVARGKA